MREHLCLELMVKKQIKQPYRIGNNLTSNPTMLTKVISIGMDKENPPPLPLSVKVHINNILFINQRMFTLSPHH